MHKKLNQHKGVLILLDLFIIMLALFASWVIRSQFNFFVYDIKKFSFLFPWVLITRILSHHFFELYSFSMVAFGSRDITRIFKFNLIPTVILLFLRFFPNIPNSLSMPLSMIIMEYLFSTVGFVVIRLIFHSKMIKIEISPGYRRRIILWSEIVDIEELITIEELSDNGTEVIGILNANPLFWNKEFKGIRIYGGINELTRISAEDDRVSAVAVLKPEDMTKKQKKEMSLQAEKLNMEIGFIEKNTYIIKDNDWLNKED